MRSQSRRFFIFFLFAYRKSITTKSVQTTTSTKQPSKWKAIKVVFFTTGSFVITWMPYFIASSMYVHCDPQKTPEFCNNLRIAIASPLAILGFANSLLNPIIYAWWHNGFRETAKRIYRQTFCKKHKASARTNKTTNPSSEPDGSRSPDISHVNFSSTTSMTASDVETSMTDYENRVTMPATRVTVIEASNRRYRNM
jgi:7 transmembrane receptor (rhodopsin family)